MSESKGGGVEKFAFDQHKHSSFIIFFSRFEIYNSVFQCRNSDCSKLQQQQQQQQQQQKVEEFIRLQ